MNLWYMWEINYYLVELNNLMKPIIDNPEKINKDTQAFFPQTR